MNFNRNTLINLSLLIGSIIFALLIVELSLRDYKAGFENLILKYNGNLIEYHLGGLYSYDSMLGWAPSNNVSGQKWGCNLHTQEDGIRSNGHPRPVANDMTILVVGDSFTFGDQVSDNDSWPSFLEAIIKEKVYNAGVSSYGLDQMYLRAQQLVPKYKPTILIFNFILDDLARCTQYVRQGAAKPYFDFKDDGSLVIRNQPVHFLKNTRLDWFRRVFGYSYLCHKIMSKFFPVYWYGGTSGNDNRYVPNDPYTVSMLILDKVAQMGIDYHMRVMIVVQAENFVNEESVRFVTPMLEYVQENHPNVEVINTLPFFLKMKNSDPEAFNKFYVEVNSHPSAQGNQVFAYLLASLIKSPQSDH